MASVTYSCTFDITSEDPPVRKKCDFSSEDSRLIINHCLEWHSAIVGICHESGCEGKVYRNPENHWEDIHAGASSCAFCDDPIQNYAALKLHLCMNHQQDMGYVHAQVPPNSERLSLQKTMKLFVSAPTLQFIQLRPNFGIYYDSNMNRPAMGAELLYSDELKASVSRPKPISFKHNLDLPETQVTTNAVQHLGFEAAHIIPSEDWRSDFDDFNATFDNSNLTAMNGFLNKGKWNSGIEANVRKVAKSSLATLALTICHYNPSELPRPSVSKLVHVPDSFSKVLYANKGTGTWLGQAFNVMNEEKRGGREVFWNTKCSFEELHKLNMGGISLRPVTLTWEEKVTVYRCKDTHCNQSFYDYNDFKSHNYIHRSVIRCSRCGSMFDEKEQLQQHIQICFLRCRFCEKPFSAPAKLAIHERTHTGEKPFICNVDGCGKAYASRPGLSDHKLAAHGDKQYFCPHPDCDKAFALWQNLNSHKFTHYDIMRYRCSECDLGSLRKASIERHQSRIHGGVGTVMESKEWKELAKRLKEETAAMDE